jgi:hypothetical protein
LTYSSDSNSSSPRTLRLNASSTIAAAVSASTWAGTPKPSAYSWSFSANPNLFCPSVPAVDRLFPQPVFRSPEMAADGYGVFVFVKGNRSTMRAAAVGECPGGMALCLARQTKFGLRATLDGKPTGGRSPNHQPLRDPKTPFLVLSEKP